MPTTFRATPRAALAAFLLVIPASGRILAADPATDEYEQARVERFADRIVRVVNTDHARWLKVLEDAYPGRVTEPADRAGYAAWFELLGGDGEWRRAGSPTGAVAALFDRVVESRRLGPVPSISRAEFLRYADRELDRGRRRAAESVPEYDAEADRVFRALDRDADGILAPEEMTTAVRRGGLAADPDANGRVDRDEYRAFFRRLVEANNEAAVARAARGGRDGNERRDQADVRTGDADTEVTPLPEWFAAADADGDGQISLPEWLRAGGDIDYFFEMDLDEDGLLPEDEYRRWAVMNQADVPPGGW